jgi:hypothetical protein
MARVVWVVLVLVSGQMAALMVVMKLAARLRAALQKQKGKTDDDSVRQASLLLL